MDALISVIVPVYKVEKELPRCVDSILRQTYPHLQIILVDDGSPDGCGAICDAYAAAHENVQVIHKENGGLSDARNAGIEHADGDYLMFIDSDDYIEPDMAEKLYRALQSADADMSICNYLHDCAPNEAQSYPNDLPIADGVLSGREILAEQVFVGSGVWFIIVCNKLYSKKLFDEIRFPVGKLNEDEFVFHRIMLQCERVACVHDALYHYVIRPGSIMRSDFSSRRFDAAEAAFLRAEELARLEFPSLAVCRTLERGIALFKVYYASADYLDAGCRKRYRTLLRRCRKAAFRYYFAPGLPAVYRAIFILKTCAPHLCWKLMRKRSA